MARRMGMGLKLHCMLQKIQIRLIISQSVKTTNCHSDEELFLIIVWLTTTHVDYSLSNKLTRERVKLYYQMKFFLSKYIFLVSLSIIVVTVTSNCCGLIIMKTTETELLQLPPQIEWLLGKKYNYHLKKFTKGITMITLLRSEHSYCSVNWLINIGYFVVDVLYFHWHLCTLTCKKCLMFSGDVEIFEE